MLTVKFRDHIQIGWLVKASLFGVSCRGAELMSARDRTRDPRLAGQGAPSLEGLPRGTGVGGVTGHPPGHIEDAERWPN